MSGKKQYNEFIRKPEYYVMVVWYLDTRLEVLIDLEDYNLVHDTGKWHAIYDKSLKKPAYYIANRYNSKSRGKGVIKLHRLVTNCPTDKVVDHVNHNTLDNRKSNLRVCTTFDNQQNLRSNKSGIVGVHKRARGNWVGKISKDNKVYSKEFKTKEEAIEYRNKMYQELYGGDD